MCEVDWLLGRLGWQVRRDLLAADDCLCWKERRSNDAEDSVRRQLREWFGVFVDSWPLWMRYDVSHALPSQPVHFQDGLPLPALLFDGVC